MKSISILVVEDQPSVSDYMDHELKKAGYTSVKAVHSANKVISEFRKMKPDIVLMDIQLGDAQDGIEISRRLKEIQDIPIIYTTAHADTKTVEKAVGTTPDGYLVKPFDKHGLYAAIETALYKNKLYNELSEKNRQLELEINARKKAEQNLKISENRNQELMNGISDAVYVLDKHWRYVTLNDAACKLAGMESHKLMGASLFEVFPGVEATAFYKSYEKAMAQRTKEIAEDEFKLPDGRNAWFEVKVYPVREGILCIASEITERKSAEQKLAESEEKYRSFVQNSTDSFALTDELGTVIEWNKSQENLSGIKASEAIGKKIWDVHGLFKMPDSSEELKVYELKKCMENFFNNGKAGFLEQNREVTMINANEELREMQQRSFKIDTDKGFRLGAVSRDITDLKRTIQALKESEARFQLLSDVTFEGIILHKNGIAFEINQSFTRITGYAREEIIGRNVFDKLVLEEDRHLIYNNIQKKHAHCYVVRVRKKEGVIIYAEIQERNIVYKDEQIRIAAVRDVSKRIEGETRLKESEEKYRTLVENANGLIYTFALDGMLNYISPNCTEMLGFLPEEYVGKTIFDFMHPDDIPATRALLQNTIKSGSKVSNVEYRSRHKNGTYRWFLANGSPLFDQTGELTGFMGIAHDVTARKNAEFLLRESEEKNRSIIEALPDMLFEITSKGIFTAVNANNPENLFLPIDRFLYKNIFEVMPSGFAKQTMHYVKKALREKTLQVFEYEMEVAGHPRHFEARINCKGEEHVIILVRDVTDRKNAEAQQSALAAIIENSDNIAVIKDLDLRVIATNNAFVKAAGKTHISDMIGKTDAEIFGVSADTEPVKSYMEDERKAQKLKKGERILKEEPIIYPNGEVHTILTTKFPVFDNKDQLIATANISSDITKQKNAIERLKVLLKYAESLAECSRSLLSGEEDSLTKGMKQILKASESSRIYIFRNFEDPRDGLCMKQIHEVCMHGVKAELDNPALQHVPYKNGFGDWKDKLEKGDIINSVVREQPQDVRKILELQGIKSVLIIPVFIKNEWFGFIGFDDVEKEREWQEQDMKLLRTVSDIIGFYFQNRESEQKILQNNRVLKSLNSTKDKMMSIIGHDLKNPISQILGFADLLLHNYDKYNDEKIRYFHNIIYSSTQQVSSLLENLLQWSRAERGKLQFHPTKVDVSVTAENTVSLMHAVALNKEIRLTNKLDKEIMVNADVHMVETIWRNLISNAIKFTDRGGEVTLDYATERNYIRFSVSDTGVGMTKEVMESLFNSELNVSTSGTLGEPGTGLGLSICKEFVEKHKGILTVKSEPGKGSTFSFTLPRA